MRRKKDYDSVVALCYEDRAGATAGVGENANAIQATTSALRVQLGAFTDTCAELEHGRGALSKKP